MDLTMLALFAGLLPQRPNLRPLRIHKVERDEEKTAIRRELKKTRPKNRKSSKKRRGY